ncbi:MAG: siphovirus ReqiPepy6 Gp37-like family protein [Clostridia bacterium]|nr:siphovirus ReqiPepy6 Gp37-like family protein [Clostridia bacterium]
MNIRVIENDLSGYKIIAGAESIVFTQAFNSRGSFEVAINANNPTAKYLSEDKLLWIDSEKIGYINSIIRDRKGGKAEEYIIARGVELKDQLDRITYPDSGLDADSYTNEYLETIIKSLIQKNASGTAVISGVATAASARQIAGLKVAADEQRGLRIDYSTKYKDLSKEIYSLLLSQQMGLKASLDIENGSIIFDVAAGEDKRAQEGKAGGTVLSLKTKTALEIVDTTDKQNYKNLSVTAGQGEGAGRPILEVYTEESEPSGYGRREVFTEARDIESEEELATRGAQKLSEISITRAISANANTAGAYKIGVDYKLGDFVSVDTDTGLYDVQIVGMKHLFKRDEASAVELMLNYDVDARLAALITAKHMDYDALVAAGTGGGGGNPASLCALSVAMSANTSTANGNTLNFNTILYDTAAKYNTSAKEFAAPVDGLYEIKAQIYVQTPMDRNYYGIEVYVNGALHSGSWRYASGTAWCIPILTKDILLAADDVVKLKAKFNDTKVVIANNTYTWWQMTLKRDDS